jgi:hypothetical protein
MSAKRDLIKYLVDYLGDVYYGDEIKEKNQDFFVSPKELERILRKYFLFFENNNELISSVKKNYNYIKDMSFQNKADSYFKIKLVDSKGKSIPTNVRYTTEQHYSLAHRIHSYLMRAFEDKLGVKEKKEKKRITVKNKRTVDVVKRLNLEVEFLREDCTPEDFIDVLKGTSEKGIYININNRNFYYLLSKIKEYFYNFSITAVAETNKIHSKNGTLFTANNLNNAKVDYPSLKERIDSFF